MIFQGRRRWANRRGPLSKAMVSISLENVYLRNLLSCLSELVCSHKTSRNEPSGVQARLLNHSWWPVRGWQEEWDTRLVSPRGRMWDWEKHSMERTVGDTPGEVSKYK